MRSSPSSPWRCRNGSFVVSLSLRPSSWCLNDGFGEVVMPQDVAKPSQLPSPDGCQETFSARAHAERGPPKILTVSNLALLLVVFP